MAKLKIAISQHYTLRLQVKVHSFIENDQITESFGRLSDGISYIDIAFGDIEKIEEVLEILKSMHPPTD